MTHETLDPRRDALKAAVNALGGIPKQKPTEPKVLSLETTPSREMPRGSTAVRSALGKSGSLGVSGYDSYRSPSARSADISSTTSSHESPAAKANTTPSTHSTETSSVVIHSNNSKVTGEADGTVHIAGNPRSGNIRDFVEDTRAAALDTAEKLRTHTADPEHTPPNTTIYSGNGMVFEDIVGGQVYPPQQNR